MTEPAPDLRLAATLFRALRDDSRDGDGVTRDAYGPGEQRAHGRIAAEGRRLGLERHVDPAGNLALTLPGRDRNRRKLVLGSHPDSVRRGGDYDGTAGRGAGGAGLHRRVPARRVGAGAGCRAAGDAGRGGRLLVPDQLSGQPGSARHA